MLVVHIHLATLSSATRRHRSRLRRCRDQSGQEAAGAADVWLLYPAMCVHDAVAHGQSNDEIADHQQHRAKSDVQGEDVHPETVVPGRAGEMEAQRLGP